MARKKQPSLAIATKGEKTERKRKGKPPADAAPPPVITAEDRQHWWAKALRAKRACEEANTLKKSKDSDYQQVIKDARKAGINTAALKRAIADRDREPAEVAAEHQEFEAFRAQLGVPVGARQSNLFEAAESVDRGVMQHKAYQTGLAEGKAGQALDGDRYPNDGDLQEQYATGHGDGVEELKTSLAGGKKNKKNGGAEAAVTH